MRSVAFGINFLISCTGILFSNEENWRTTRSFCLRNLKNFGLGKSSMEGFILTELKELCEEMHPPQLGNQPRIVELDSNLNAAITSALWWLMASQ